LVWYRKAIIIMSKGRAFQLPAVTSKIVRCVTASVAVHAGLILTTIIITVMTTAMIIATTMTTIMGIRISPIRMPNIRMGQSRYDVINPQPVRKPIGD